MAVPTPGPEAFAELLSALFLLTIAAWVLYLNYGDRLNRVFAIFLALRGFLSLVDGLAVPWKVPLSPGVSDFAALASPYFHIALPFATLYLGLLLLQRYLPESPPWIKSQDKNIRLGIIIGVLLFESLYIADRTLWGTPSSVPGGEDTLNALSLFIPFRYLTYAAVAFVMVQAYLVSSAVGLRSSLLLVTLAFSLDPVGVAFSSFFTLVMFVAIGGVAALDPLWESPWDLAFLLMVIPALVLLVVAFTRLARRVGSTTDVDEKVGLRKFFLLVTVPIAAAVLLAFLAVFGSATTHGIAARSFSGLWAIALGLLTVYTLVRHQLFDVDVKVRLAIRRGTIAGVLVLTVIVVSQLLEQYFGAVFGWGMGGVAAGLLLFAIEPIKKFADKLAEKAVPGEATPEAASAFAAMPEDQRRSLYSEQVTMAWADGNLSKKDRMMLDKLRERLGLTHEIASQLELEVTSTM